MTQKIFILRTDRWYWLIWYQHKKSKPLKLPQWWRKWEQQQKLIATNSKTRHYKIKWNEHQLITLCVSMKNCNQCFYDLFTLNSHLYEWASWLHMRVEALKVMGDASQWAFMALFYDWKPSKLITLNLFFAFNCSLSHRYTLCSWGIYSTHNERIYEWECSRY